MLMPFEKWPIITTTVGREKVVTIGLYNLLPAKKKAIGQRICLLDHKNSMGRNCNEPKKPNTLARIQLPSPSEARFVEGKYLFRWMALPRTLHRGGAISTSFMTSHQQPITWLF